MTQEKLLKVFEDDSGCFYCDKHYCLVTREKISRNIQFMTCPECKLSCYVQFRTSWVRLRIKPKKG